MTLPARVASAFSVRLLLPTLLAAVLAVPAAAQWGGGGGSLYSEDGVEITVDKRVAAVFTVLNALGYDKEKHFGKPPLSLPEFSKGRTAARKALRRAGLSMKDLQATIDKYPGSPADYARAAMQLGPAPRFKPLPGASNLAKALSKDIASWYNEEGGKSAVSQAVKFSSADQKALLKPINQTCSKLTKLIFLGEEEDQLLEEETAEPGRVMLVMNPLDAHDTLFTQDGADLTTVVMGPTRQKGAPAVMAAVAEAYARQLLRNDVVAFMETDAAKTSIASGYDALGKEAKAAAKSKEGYVLDLLSCAMVKQAHPKLSCGQASLVDDKAKAALELLAPRVNQYAADHALLKAALPTLLATEAAPATPAEGADPSAGPAVPEKAPAAAAPKPAAPAGK